jgi:RHS repeat-associated protein
MKHEGSAMIAIRPMALVTALLSFALVHSVVADTLGGSDPLSNEPSDESILRSNAFGALIPVGRKTTSVENIALASALSKYRTGAYSDDVAPIIAYVEQNPDSAWNASLLLNLGIAYRNSGHFSLAASAWQNSWAQSRELSDPMGRAIADSAVGKLAAYYAHIGEEQKLSSLLDSIRGRSLTGPATEEVSSAAAQLIAMRNRPDHSFRCGALALARICLLIDNAAAAQRLFGSRAEQRGISLDQLLRLSDSAGIKYQMAFRTPGAEVVTPAIINWKSGHYSAVMGRLHDAYRVSDTLDRDIWMRPTSIDEEASGYFLVPAGKLPPGWRAVDSIEGKKVWGRGPTGGNYPIGPGPTDPQAFPICGDDGAAGGMTKWNVAAMSVSLELHDRLLTYRPALGPPVTFEIFYNQRDYQNDGNPIFQYTNFGPKWTSNWISYVDDRVPLGPVTAGTVGTAQLYLPGGGVETYNFVEGSPVSQPGLLTQAQLTKAPAQAQTESGYKFVRAMPDGSTQVFAQAVLPPLAVLDKRGYRYFLTQVIDPQGHAVTLAYDSMMRIDSITDAVGQVTRLQYDLAADPRKVTAVVDPFGRTAAFSYSADNGHLVGAMDPGGITSSYIWSANDFISQLTTPYGTTTFSTDDVLPNISGQNFWRTLTITDPLGLISRVDQRDQAPVVTGISEPVPERMNVGLEPEYLSFRNVFVWDAHQLSMAEQTPNPDGSPDYTKARILHFLHSDMQTASFVLESTKNPLENRIWYLYSGQSGGMTIGTSNKPTAVGRVLDDGTTQLATFQWNEFGHITQLVDPAGRKRTFQYAANGIDLSAVFATNGTASSTLFSAFYDSHHEPLTITDGAGAKSSLTYNANSQPLTFTNALNQTAKYLYDNPTGGFLTAIQLSTDNQNFVNQAEFSYDNYGRVRTFTDEMSYTRTVSYDVYDRPTSVAFPDGTIETWTYKFLDLETHLDRMNHKSNYVYDADRRLIRITNYDVERRVGSTIVRPERTIQFGYCQCGAVSSITDPAGNVTNFIFDADDRLISRQYADGSQTTYTYEATTQRLKSVTGGSGRGSSYSYNVDNTLSSVGDAKNAGSPTVQFNYDPVFVRLKNMTDLQGTTTYTYYPLASGAPLPGAMHLESETSPYGDTISYSYDVLGRPATRTVNGVVSSQTFDNIGRVKMVNNPLGSFTYSYLETSDRVSAIASDSGPQQQVSYYDVSGDNLPKQVSWFGPPPSAAPPSQSCDADKELLQQLETERSEDEAWILKNCASPLAEQCLQNGDSIRKSLNLLNSSEIPAAQVKLREDCTPPPPPRTLLASFSYTYNADDQITQISFAGNLINFPGTGALTNAGTYRMGYDAFGALVGVTPVGDQQGGASFSYAYSPASSLLATKIGGDTTNLPSNNLNELATADASYDGDGNLSLLGPTQYGWQFAGEAGGAPVTLGQPDSYLTEIQYHSGASGPAATTQFKYDGVGRRIEIIEKSNGAIISDRRYVWCGDTICQEHDMQAATPSLPRGPVTKSYFRQGVQVYGSRNYYYTFDKAGSVYQLIGSDGTVVASYQYDPYGNRVQVSGSIANDIGYTGLFQHQPSGLLLAEFRPYSPSIGRWLSRDALGEFAQIHVGPNGRAFLSSSRVPDVNLYSYVLNDPVNLNDKLGLQSGEWGFWTQSAALFLQLGSLWSGNPQHIEDLPQPFATPTEAPQSPHPISGGGGTGGSGGGGTGGASGGTLANLGGWLTVLGSSFCSIFPPVFTREFTPPPTGSTDRS